jgi:hypothetical protein
MHIGSLSQGIKVCVNFLQRRLFPLKTVHEIQTRFAGPKHPALVHTFESGKVAKGGL